MEEKVFFESVNNKVTNARFITHGETYALAGLTSVKMTETPSKFKGLVILAGIFLILVGIANMSENASSGLVILTLAAFLLWLGFKIKPTYSVVTVSAGGTIQALSSKDFDLINNIVNAINDAIVHRG
ncbi:MULTISPECIES: DUF6232 family protein [unclassified Sulfuricurvum]|uniref:DUF6232 family protein n=1 Tax=unclassified Sulfuricurvum TaxID=2632390 RepID=UPI000299650F|nr:MULTISPECIES: DUF6232 family protein [unclassified Sulfuricurvum]AFV96777.1 QacE-like protein [Candidatus Sulfuricurvum sp. RIFRC-1]HBM36227.1 QacE [Sulfuricurvum sp.]